jgi:hypothetical protein
LIPGIFFKEAYNTLLVSDAGSITILKVGTPALSPMNPKTKIKMKGNMKLKITAEGLRVIDRKLPLVMANMAFN